MSHLQTECHYQVEQAVNDADTKVASTALQLAGANKPVTVVANDTDIVVLLVHHFQTQMADIFISYDCTRIRNSRRTVIPVRSVASKIGNIAAEQLLVCHALTGCDTTSALYGQGKASAFRKIACCPDLLPLTRTLGFETPSQEEVVQAGLNLLVMLYGGNSSESLNHLRFLLYNRLLSTSKPAPERLPPTERAATFHVMRVHVQVVQWKTLMSDDLEPAEWGWKVHDGAYVPIDTNMPPAPNALLKVIHCSCKPSTDSSCGTLRCSCRKHGLPCFADCLHCCGTKCTNPSLQKSKGLRS